VHPYRDPSPPAPPPAEASDERAIAAVMTATGAVPVAGALAAHASFSGGVTIGLGLLVLGVIGLVRRR
jgi:hypothetical protein